MTGSSAMMMMVASTSAIKHSHGLNVTDVTNSLVTNIYFFVLLIIALTILLSAIILIRNIIKNKP